MLESVSPRFLACARCGRISRKYHTTIRGANRSSISRLEPIADEPAAASWAYASVMNIKNSSDCRANVKPPGFKPPEYNGEGGDCNRKPSRNPAIQRLITLLCAQKPCEANV